MIDLHFCDRISKTVCSCLIVELVSLCYIWYNSNKPNQYQPDKNNNSYKPKAENSNTLPEGISEIIIILLFLSLILVIGVVLFILILLFLM